MTRTVLGHCTYLALALVTGCGTNFIVPEGAVITCSGDAQCPADLPVCAVTGFCVSRELVGENGPTLLRATPASATTIIVAYDLQLLASSVTDVASYSIDGLTVFAGALRADGVSVLLETSPQVPAVSYILRTPGVRDIAGRANLDAATELRGFGLSPDELAPDLVKPADNAQIRAASVELSWSGRAVATQYFIELSRNADFNPLVMDRIEVAAPTNTYVVTLPVAGTYYWRVTSNVQSATASTTPRAFHLFDDVIYVACADAETECVGGYGTREQPLRSVAGAVELGASIGVDNVHVAGRALPYRGSLVLQRALTLVCGFDAAFVESNGQHPTTIESSSATGALLVSSLPSLTVRGCNFRDALGAAAVSIIGSQAVTFERVGIAAAAFDDIAALSLLDSTIVAQDTTVALYTPDLFPENREDARGVAVVRSRRSDATFIDSSLDGALAFEPMGIDAALSRVHLEGTRVATGGFFVDATEQGEAIGIAASQSNVSIYGSQIYVGKGFSSATGIHVRGNSTLDLVATTVAVEDSPFTSRAIFINGEMRAQIVNSILFPGAAGSELIALEVALRGRASLEVYHSLLMGAPGSDSPVVLLSLPDNAPASCEPYDFTFVNNVIAAGSNGLGNIIATGSESNNAHVGTLFQHNALVTTGPDDCIRYSDTSSSNAEDLGCGADSFGNVLRSRTIAQLLGNLAGADGNVATAADNDFRPDGANDRAILRNGRTTVGMCAAQPCIPVTQDITGAVRTTSPPSMGPYDLP